MEIIYGLLLRVLPFIAAGFALRMLSFKKAESYIRVFIDFALYFLVPVFVFFTMWAAPPGNSMAPSRQVAFAAFAVVLAGAFYALVYARFFSVRFKDAVLPISMMNSAYLAIPVNAAVSGPDGTFFAVVYNIIITLLHFSAGLAVVSGSVREIFRLPVLYAALAGAALNMSGFPEPASMKGFSAALTGVTLPAMLCVVGYQVKPVSFGNLGKVVFAVSLRMFGGLAAALAICEIFGIIGAARAVCLVSSSMPPAVNAYLLTKKYGADYAFASSMITVGLIMSLIVVPLAIWIK